MMADEVSKLASLEEGGISMNLEMEVQKCPSIEEVPTFAIQRAQLDDTNRYFPPRWAPPTEYKRSQEGQEESSQIYDPQ